MKKTPVQGKFAPSSAGFSLIELAIGMALVGIILGGALLIGGKLWDSDRRETNREHLQAIKTALLDFARKNGRLPMMDTAVNSLTAGDGFENTIPNDDNYPLAGSGPFGWVPYKNIDTAEKDAFGKPVQYFVNWQLAKGNKNRPCQALKNMMAGKYAVVSPNIYNYYKQVDWDVPPPLPPLAQPTTWYPLVQVKNNVPLPVAAVLVNSGPDKDYDEFNYDAYQITSRYFVAKVSSATFDDVVVYVTLSEAYEALNCQ